MPGWLFPEHALAFLGTSLLISDKNRSEQIQRSIPLSQHQLPLLQPQTWPGTASYED